MIIYRIIDGDRRNVVVSGCDCGDGGVGVRGGRRSIVVGGSSGGGSEGDKNTY